MFAVMLIGDAPEADAAVRAAGGEVAARVGWNLDAVEGWPVVLVEAEGVAIEMLAEMLPRVAAMDGAVVTIIEETQIDVAAVLLGPRAQLLVRPTMAERVAAIAVAAMRDAGGVREGSDGERLRRLHAEIGRIAETLARLAEPSDPAETVGDRRLGYGTDESAAPTAAVPVTADDLRRTIRARRLRERFLGDGLFEDPAWDMLLDLFAAELEGARVSVSSLCIAAAVAPTTALRWIGRMIDAGLLERQPDPRDRRRAFMALTVRGRGGLQRYFAALEAAGLSIV